MAKKEKRFVVYSEPLGLAAAKIIMDSKTGVHYLFFTDGSAGGLTVLLGKDGKPIIQKLSEEDGE